MTPYRPLLPPWRWAKSLTVGASCWLVAIGSALPQTAPPISEEEIRAYERRWAEIQKAQASRQRVASFLKLAYPDPERTDAPDPEPGKAEELAPDVPKSDVPKSDVPKSDVPKSDVPKSDVPKSDGLESDGLESDGLESDGLESDGLEPALSELELSDLGPRPWKNAAGSDLAVSEGSDPEKSEAAEETVSNKPPAPLPTPVEATPKREPVRIQGNSIRKLPAASPVLRGPATTPAPVFPAASTRTEKAETKARERYRRKGARGRYR